MKKGFIDPYLEQDTGILKNLLNIKNDEELKSAETDLVYAKEIILSEVDITRTNNVDELLSIHKFLFEDIYEWAGKIRTVDIAKHNDRDNFFLIYSKIETGLDYIFNELQQNNCLKNLSEKDFIEKLAYFYEQLNFIHPFREGNGRTQRIFWSRVVKDTGHKIDWSKIIGEENNNACKVASKNQDLTLLIKMFEKIVSKI